jgi:hypothetical protein
MNTFTYSNFKTFKIHVKLMHPEQVIDVTLLFQVSFPGSINARKIRILHSSFNSESMAASTATF